VLASGRYILGPEVEAFEREWAAYLRVGYAVGVANGTDALELALRAAGVGEGDYVVTAANTVTATVTAIERAGARVALADVEPDRFTLAADSVARLLDAHRGLRGRVRAIVPVHLYGMPADLPGLAFLAREIGAVVVEDCAQAHGARLHGREVGSWGTAAAFSFYPTKNLGAIGDGGAVVTGDERLAQRVRSLRQYGWSDRYVALQPGLNSRLDEMQAAVLRVRLESLEKETRLRCANARRYLEALQGIGELALPCLPDGAEAVWHQFVVRHPRRDALARHLAERGIGTGILYPLPIHAQPAYSERVLLPPDGLPVAERICREVLCLPVHPFLKRGDVGRVVKAIRSFER
jgi:dTDP-4-amino-4,6-dideoxygalactose transaminase